jgi:hypothetical protein
MTPRLTPSIPSERLYPRNAAFMTRTDLEQTRLLVFEPWNLESITNICLGLMNGLATVRHRSGATEDILALFERAGLPVDEDLHTYETGDEAERMADELIEEGRKLVFLYPLREGRFADSSFLVPPGLWRRLNSKQHLAKLVSAAHLAPRRLRSLQELEREGFEHAVFLKDASLEASGGGCAVRACFDAEQWRGAVEELRQVGVTQFLWKTPCPLSAVGAWRSCSMTRAQCLLEQPSRCSKRRASNREASSIPNIRFRPRAWRLRFRPAKRRAGPAFAASPGST